MSKIEFKKGEPAASVRIPLVKQAQSKLASQEDKLDKKSAKEAIEQLVGLLKNHPQVIDLFARFNIPIEQFEKIPIGFKPLDVSAKTKNGHIWLNENLLDSGELAGHLPYVIHELVHVLQQISGAVADHDPADYDEYLDDPLEVDAFKEQISFIHNYKGEDDAKKYLDELLDFHELDGNQRKSKERELAGKITEAAPKYVRIHVRDQDGRQLQHHYLDAQKWESPAGRIEAGEEPFDAAVRELLERTGYRVDAADLVEEGESVDGDFWEFGAEMGDLEQIGEPQTEVRMGDCRE